jgi:hypothetical protein
MNREALKARHMLKVSLENNLFRAFSARRMAIATPGPFGRAIAFRACSAQNNTLRKIGLMHKYSIALNKGNDIYLTQ